MDRETIAIIKVLIAIAIGFLLGFTYGNVKSMSYLRETCEKHNTFYYKHNNTTYYCATEHQLRKYQK